MTNQRLRNLTTGILHTSLEHVFEDIQTITGKKQVKKNQFLNALKAMEPYLRRVCTDQRLWQHHYDPEHLGDTEVVPMELDEQEKFWRSYKKLENLW